MYMINTLKACALVITLLLLCLFGVNSEHNTESGSGNPEPITLWFSFITSISGSFKASGAIPAIDLALEQINNNTNILHDYQLNYSTIEDSGVSIIIIPVHGLQLFYSYTYNYI